MFKVSTVETVKTANMVLVKFNNNIERQLVQISLVHQAS